MSDFLLGVAGYFVMLVAQKTIFEPIAETVGDKLVARFVGPCCKELDRVFMQVGLHKNADSIVREYLRREPEVLTESQIQRIATEVFKVYDIRLIK